MTVDRQKIGARWRDKYIVDESTGCWLWTATTTAAGYGQVGLGGRVLLAHRAVYEELVGTIPNGLYIDHLCRVRNCINPEHLEPVTPAENARRAAPYMAKEVCRNGHVRTPESTYIDPQGSRECATCKRASDASGRLKRGLEHERAISAAYRDAHREEINAYFTEWRAKNREAQRRYHAEWREKNKDRLGEYRRAWRGAKKGTQLQAEG